MIKSPVGRNLLYGMVIVNIMLLGVNGFLLSRNATDGTGANDKKFPFLSKRIFAENQNDIVINFIPLRQKLHEYVSKTADDQVGVYFEYLPSGVSIGVNDRRSVNIASLLKVPLIMAVYKQLELGNMSKDQKLTIRQADLDSKYGDLWKRGAGAKVTVDEAIELAIKKSCNTASNVLLNNIPFGELDMVADSLDIPKERQGKFVIINPKNYSSVLRSLYLSAYLSRSSSNEILELLTQTEFSDQIPAGVGTGVKVAHKIGEYSLNTSELPTYSDCGIVYAPKRPYFFA